MHDFQHGDVLHYLDTDGHPQTIVIATADGTDQTIAQTAQTQGPFSFVDSKHGEVDYKEGRFYVRKSGEEITGNFVHYRNKEEIGTINNA